MNASEEAGRSRFRLVIFDLDGTLIRLDKSVWQLLHDALGTDPEERTATLRAARSGAITYDEWFQTDLVMLREAGARRGDIARILGGLEVQEGAWELMDALREAGTRLAVISGGLKMTVDLAFPDFEFDRVFINEVHYDEEGTILGGASTPYDGPGKARGLEKLAREWDLSADEIAFVGDGSNDVEIAACAGFSVAWGNAPEGLKAVSTCSVPGPDLRELIGMLTFQ